jgi:hypothetical protein
MAAGKLNCLAMMFPEEDKVISRFPFFRWIGPHTLVGTIPDHLPTIYNYTKPLAYALGWRAGYVYSGVAVFLFLVSMFYRRHNSASPIIREQTRLTLIGAGFSFLPIAIWFISASIWPSLAFSPILSLPIIIFPVVIAYTLARTACCKQNIFFNK